MSKLKINIKKLVSFISAFVVAFFAFNFSSKPLDTDSAEMPDLEYITEQMELLINKARTEEGLEPLKVVPYLCDCSKNRAREIAVDRFDHRRWTGQYVMDEKGEILRDENGELVKEYVSFQTVIDLNTFNAFSKSKENIAAGSSDPEVTFGQWKNSAKHWAAIMTPEITHMGVGVTYEPNSEYKWYWETLFIVAYSDATINGEYFPPKVTPIDTGDLNGDGCIDSFDYITLMRYINDPVKYPLNPLQLQAAEIVQDGQLNITDAAYLQKYILGSIDSVPVRLW